MRQCVRAAAPSYTASGSIQAGGAVAQIHFRLTIGPRVPCSAGTGVARPPVDINTEPIVKAGGRLAVVYLRLASVAEIPLRTRAVVAQGAEWKCGSRGGRRGDERLGGCGGAVRAHTPIHTGRTDCALIDVFTTKGPGPSNWACAVELLLWSQTLQVHKGKKELVLGWVLVWLVLLWPRKCHHFLIRLSRHHSCKKHTIPQAKPDTLVILLDTSPYPYPIIHQS